MKKRTVLILMTGCLLSGCGTNSEVQVKKEIAETNEQEQSPPAFMPLPAADVVEIESSGEINNLDRFYAFLEKAEEKETDHIQIRQFTTEGDPVSRDVQFDGSVFKSILNSTRDQYGSGGIEKTVCTGLVLTETAESADYLLKDCDNNRELHLATVPK